MSCASLRLAAKHLKESRRAVVMEDSQVQTLEELELLDDIMLTGSDSVGLERMGERVGGTA